MDNKYTAYYFSGTHWDREWYQSFQGFRFRLVNMMDELIDELENDDRYGVFHFDGQTVVLEDYLEIRPEQKPRLEKLIKTGKIIIGPWYCMPDEFNLSGESLIRNLQKGFKISRSYGVEPLKYGYICDIFGHIAQMPQIFKGFDIDGACLGRGTNEFNTPMNFNWESPDGSRVITHKLKDSNGYGSITGDVFNCGGGEEKTIEFINYEKKRANVPVILITDALDHKHIQKEYPDYIKIIEKNFPEIKVLNVNVENMVNQLKEYDLPVKYGELNETAKVVANYVHLISNTLSSHYPIKKKNDMLQNMIEKWVRPMYAFNLINEHKSYLEVMDSYLIKNHAHDSICGCSIAQVHQDMHCRFAQVNSIGETLMNQYKFNETGEDGSRQFIKVFNPLPYSIKKEIEVEIDFDENYKAKFGEPFKYEMINTFTICDSNGNDIPYQILDINNHYRKLNKHNDYPFFDCYKVCFYAELAPFGTTTFEIKPSEHAIRYLDYMKSDMYGAENDYLAFSIKEDGTICLTDKLTGKTYNKLLATFDDGEIGDGWYHGDFNKNYKVLSSLESVEKISDGYNKVSFKIIQKLVVPDSVKTFERNITRNPYKKTLYIDHIVSLYRNSKFIDVQTTIHNNVRDHQVKLILPLEHADTYKVDQAFCFVERKTGIDIETQNWKERSSLEKSTSGVVAVNDIAFISKGGIHECGVDEEGNTYITLARCFERTPRMNGEDFGELQGDLDYHYIILPIHENTDAELEKQKDILQTGIMAINSYENEIPNDYSLFEVKGKNIVYSTSNIEDNGIIVRVYNASKDESDAEIVFDKNIKSAVSVNFDGKKLSTVSFNDNKINDIIPTCKIVTYKITF